ncbi:MAG: DGQHR domain-containing protein [Nitrososphaerota archaeon]|jgi:DNA sulfur modification protein DndB|nr:DGQHR domain-containing protein [Nitrososphaerota archaeon]
MSLKKPSEPVGSQPPLILAALRAQMGDWTYYMTYMTMQEISRRIVPAQTFSSSKVLQEWLQRKILNERKKQIEHYLVTQPQRFFNSIVVGTYGGDPQWSEVIVDVEQTSDLKLPENLQGVIGFLTLSGAETLFAIDGQHRVEGIRLTVKDHPNFGEEEVPMILVKGITVSDRLKDPDGFQRTRRLFTTLNRYAKPVSKKDIIVLDEDDAIAIITRRLIEEYPLFSESKISVKATTNIPLNDKLSFTSINALYDALNIFLRNKPKSGWNEFKRFYPGDETIEEFYQKSIELWDTMCNIFPAIAEMKNSKPEEETAGKYRTIDGGNILFRPIGLLLFIKIIRLLMDNNGLKLSEAIERLVKIPLELSNEAWTHLLWNPLNHRIFSNTLNRNIAEKLLFHATGGSLMNVFKTNSAALRNDIANIKNIDKEKVKLSFDN